MLYRVTIETGRRLTRVKPDWSASPGARASPPTTSTAAAPPAGHDQDRDLEGPVPGRIVAGGSHVHGGNFGVRLTEPAAATGAGGSKPLFGRPTTSSTTSSRFYQPGPFSTSWMLSRTGAPVVKGEVLHVSAAYDAQYNHAGHTAIMHLYIARARRPRRPAPRCPRTSPTRSSATTGGLLLPT